jgi:hypothetical protein
MNKKIFLGIGLLACLSFLTQAQTWDSAKRLTYTTGDSEQSAIAAYSVHVHVVWIDDVSGADELYYKKSTDLGATWAAPTRLTWSGAQLRSPEIGVNGPTIHVVYLEDNDVIYRRSTDNGATWSRNQITWGLTAGYVEMAVNGVYLHLAITAYPLGTSNIGLYYKRSTNAGASWSTPLNLGRVGGFMGLFASSIFASGSNVHVAYSNDVLHVGHMDMFYRRSVDSGVTWSVPLQVARLEKAWLQTSSDDPNFAISMSVAASGTNVHVLYTAASSLLTVPLSNLYCKTSTNSGVTWGATQQVTYGDQVLSISTKGSAAEGANVYLTYLNRGTDDVYFKKSTDTGATWTAPVRLTYIGSSGSDYPTMAYDSGSGYFHIVFGVYVDPTYADEIYYKRGH